MLSSDRRNTLAEGVGGLVYGTVTPFPLAQGYSAAVETSPLYLAIGFVSWPVMRLVYRLRATGLENLPEGGFVLAANHTSNFDPWPLGFPLWPRRQLFFMAKAELFNPVLGPFLRTGGTFPVRRGQHDAQAIETAVRLCREGKAPRQAYQLATERLMERVYGLSEAL